MLLLEAMPAAPRRLLLMLLDTLAFLFFAVLLFYGLGLVEKGFGRFTMIHGVNKALPFAAVPVSAALACIQLLLVAVRDQAGLHRSTARA
jgi:TRAP-type C4-dicarboxylate transport system permease small subunit